MILITLIIFFSYLIIFIRLKFIPPDKAFISEKKISLIIAAKNEENNLPDLINSLVAQNYSEDKFEVIIVDDNSIDATYTIAQKFVNKYSYIRVIKTINNKYEGKRGALQTGIDSSMYQYIVITDADCRVNKDFIKSYSDKFSENYEFIFGVAPYIQRNDIINKIASFDNLWVHILTFSFANIGLPYSAAARSFGFKKEAFKRIEGYKKTTDTLSGDDDLLLREAVKNKLRIGTIINPDSFVITNTENSLKGFIKQKSRHTTTSNYYSNKVKIFLGLWHILNLFMLFSIFLVSFNINYIWMFVTKIIGDIFIIKYIMTIFSYKFNLLEIIGLQITYELFLIVNYIMSLFGRDKW